MEPGIGGLNVAQRPRRVARQFCGLAVHVPPLGLALTQPFPDLPGMIRSPLAQGHAALPPGLACQLGWYGSLGLGLDLIVPALLEGLGALALGLPCLGRLDLLYGCLPVMVRVGLVVGWL